MPTKVSCFAYREHCNLGNLGRVIRWVMIWWVNLKPLHQNPKVILIIHQKHYIAMATTRLTYGCPRFQNMEMRNVYSGEQLMRLSYCRNGLAIWCSPGMWKNGFNSPLRHRTFSDCQFDCQLPSPIRPTVHFMVNVISELEMHDDMFFSVEGRMWRWSSAVMV